MSLAAKAHLHCARPMDLPGSRAVGLLSQIFDDHVLYPHFVIRASFLADVKVLGEARLSRVACLRVILCVLKARKYTLLRLACVAVKLSRWTHIGWGWAF